MNKFLSAVGITAVALTAVGCNYGRGGRGGFWPFGGRGRTPTETLERGQTRFTARFINALGVNAANNTVFGNVNFLANGEIIFRDVRFLKESEHTDYVARIPLGNITASVTPVGSTAPLVTNTIRFFEGLSSIFLYNFQAGGAAPTTAIPAFLVLSDDQAVGAPSTGGTQVSNPPAGQAGVRIVDLSRNLGFVDAYIQPSAGGTAVKVLDGRTAGPGVAAIPNWTQFDDSNALIAGVFLEGVNARPNPNPNVTALSNYVYVPLGAVNLVTVVEGGTVGTDPNLTPGVSYTLNNCNYTIVLADPNTPVATGSTTTNVVTQIYVDEHHSVRPRVQGNCERQPITSTMPIPATGGTTTTP